MKKGPRPGKPNLTKEQRDEIVRRMYAGEDIDSVAEETGLSLVYLKAIRRRALDPSIDLLDPAICPAWFKKYTRGKTNGFDRREILKRALAGENLAKIAREYNVTRAYISLIKNLEVNPGRFAAKKKFSAKRLSPVELEEFKKAFASSTPTDHELIPHSDNWTIDYGYQLAEKLFKKRPSKRVIVECVQPYLIARRANYFPRPQPPKPRHIDQLSPELAKDPDFVAYYMSPLAQKIAQKEYELALADYEARFAGKEESRSGSAEKAKRLALAAQEISKQRGRLGKHAQTKVSRDTPPKRKKKR